MADILSRMHEDRKSEELFGPILPIPNIIGRFIAPAHTVLDDWMEDYRQDHEVFTYFFNPTTRELKEDKRQHFKYGRLWADDKSLSKRTVSKRSSRPTMTPLSRVTGGYTEPSA